MRFLGKGIEKFEVKQDRQMWLNVLSHSIHSCYQQ